MAYIQAGRYNQRMRGCPHPKEQKKRNRLNEIARVSRKRNRRRNAS